MRLEIRRFLDSERKPVATAVIVSESADESKILDELFGSSVVDGLCGTPKVAECRLSDGYGEHYVLIK